MHLNSVQNAFPANKLLRSLTYQLLATIKTDASLIANKVTLSSTAATHIVQEIDTLTASLTGFVPQNLPAVLHPNRSLLAKIVELLAVKDDTNANAAAIIKSTLKLIIQLADEVRDNLSSHPPTSLTPTPLQSEETR